MEYFAVNKIKTQSKIVSSDQRFVKTITTHELFSVTEMVCKLFLKKLTRFITITQKKHYLDKLKYSLWKFQYTLFKTNVI